MFGRMRYNFKSASKLDEGGLEMTTSRVYYFGLEYSGPMRPGRMISPLNRKLNAHCVGVEWRNGNLWLVCPSSRIPGPARTILEQQGCKFNMQHFTE